MVCSTCHTSAKNAGVSALHCAAVVPGAPGPRTAATYAATSAAASSSSSPALRCSPALGLRWRGRQRSDGLGYEAVGKDYPCMLMWQ